MRPPLLGCKELVLLDDRQAVEDALATVVEGQV